MHDKDFHSANNRNKTGRETINTLISSRKKRRRLPKLALINIRNLGTPLISGSTAETLDSFSLQPDRPYTVGRRNQSCDFIIRHPSVSRQHCQILFDSKTRNLHISDGVIGSEIDGCRRRLFCANELDKEIDNPGSSKFKVSSNGVFVNGARITEHTARELLIGDEVLFAKKCERLCNKQVLIGFVVQRITYEETEFSGYEERTSSEGRTTCSGHSHGTTSAGKTSKRVFAPRENDIMSPALESSAMTKVNVDKRINVLLSHCRHILHSADPISCLRLSVITDSEKKCRFCNTIKLLESEAYKMAKIPSCLGREIFEPNSKKELVLRDIREDTVLRSPPRCVSDGIGALKQITGVANGQGCCDADEDKDKTLLSNCSNKEKPYVDDNVTKDRNYKCPYPAAGKNFYLNRLPSVDQTLLGYQAGVSLPELLWPVDNILQIFIATFTSDILWFLSCCDIPYHLPLTVACQNTERCWDSSPDARIAAPYPNYPNLTMVFPPFPEDIAFGKDRKKQGIACHHPKLFVLQREDSIRVIITSANLVAKQWNSVTNTVWFQDFPRRDQPDYLSIFPRVPGDVGKKGLRSDFAAQLAAFVACLLVDVPSQAHWIFELTKYNFEGATGHLVASVPGIHSCRVPRLTESSCFKPDSGVLGSVEASVVGLSFLFRATNDSKGEQLKKLASFLSKSQIDTLGMLEVVLRRNVNVPADINAVSVFIRNPNDGTGSDCVQLGFLPRNVAKWVSPLWDIGFFRFLGYVYRDEALGAASGRNNQKVQLMLHVLQGPSISNIATVIQPLHISALCSLIASVQRCVGIWRLQEVLGQYKWPESQDSELIYSSSSIGSSVNPEFLAAFSAAAGKKACQNYDSQESDPEWGCWNASHERKAPSIRIIFPTIERVKNACDGVLPSKRMLCFSEKTWQRLRHFRILHDAVPHPSDRVGHPMHVKVARRRFYMKKGSSSVGWVYCGSHNFSPAAWGQTIAIRSRKTDENDSYINRFSFVSSVSKLRICNYELGIVFVFPPQEGKLSGSKGMESLDDIVLPFEVPPPEYGPHDRPATSLAMREALIEVDDLLKKSMVEEEMIDEEIVEEEDEEVQAREFVAEEKEEDKTYAETLWSQNESSSG